MTIDEKIKELSWTGPGEAYSAKGKRNPIRDDTQNVLTGIIAAVMPQNILEFGTAFGLSGLCMLRGCDKTRLTTIEFDYETSKKAQLNFNEAAAGRVKVLSGDVGSVLATMSGEKFDVLFLDHEKHKYLEHYLYARDNGILAEHHLILADNVADRLHDCSEFVNWVAVNLPESKIVMTECGLLVAKV
jgi:predicted O-methyltransferase YrrM